VTGRARKADAEVSRPGSDREVDLPSAESLLTAEDLKGVFDGVTSEIRDAIRGRLEKLRDAYEERLRKRGEEWRREADALLDRLSKAEALVEELRTRFEGLGEARGQAGLTPAPAASPAKSPVAASVGLADELGAQGFEVIDKRGTGGNLWVIGPAEKLKPVMAGLQRRGVKFVFAAKGGRATGGRAAWFTKSGK
jgi:hypothetical protein